MSDTHDKAVKAIADRMSDLEHSKDSWEADAESVIAALAEAGLMVVPLSQKQGERQ